MEGEGERADSGRTAPAAEAGERKPKRANLHDVPLPTASTCMSLLKLPDYGDEQMLKSKLLMAVRSRSGFELS